MNTSDYKDIKVEIALTYDILTIYTEVQPSGELNPDVFGYSEPFKMEILDQASTLISLAGPLFFIYSLYFVW